jgi:hypothetical protein
LFSFHSNALHHQPSNQVSAGALVTMTLATVGRYRPLALTVVRYTSIQVLITAVGTAVVIPHTRAAGGTGTRLCVAVVNLNTHLIVIIMIMILGSRSEVGV